jgi:hypothetical protein
VGNRMSRTTDMPYVRTFVNRWMSRRLSRICGLEMPDSQCGFRLLRLNSWRRFKFRASRFEIESEMLVRFASAGLTIRFVPIQTRYAEEKSKIKPVRDTIRWFRWEASIRAELKEMNGAWAIRPEMRGQPTL